MALKRNLIANYVGQGWSALMGFVFIPVYIRYLGIEAYGLIGMFALLQSLLTLLDLGLTPSLSREMARFTGGSHTAQSIRDLLRSVEFISLTLAFSASVGILLSSSWLATSWMQKNDLPTDIVSQAITAMGLVASLRLIENVYRSCIIGLQYQVTANVLNSLLATLRGIGAVAVLILISPTISAFFIWQAIMSLISICVLATTTYLKLPPCGRVARISLKGIQPFWRFAGGMYGITLLSLILTQLDKVLLTRLLNLADLGYYNVAAVAASSLSILIAPITQACYPRLCELYARGEQAKFVETYHFAAQCISVVVGSAAVVVFLFSEALLRIWTQDATLASKSANILAVLILGNLLNGLMWIPYQAQLAHGWTGLAIRMNAIAIVVLFPTIIWATTHYGAIGAASVWVVLNAAYILIGVHFMYRKILRDEKSRWYRSDLLYPLAAAIVVAVGCRFLLQPTAGSVYEFLFIFGVSIATFLASLASADQLRPYLLVYVDNGLRLAFRFWRRLQP